MIKLVPLALMVLVLNGAQVPPEIIELLWI
jgi:hypothetical protein